ncbi:NUDIX domain-containing protein [Dongia sp.]|uniref:NUDIX domain-containing protein n=1 Tax=Dongia sp. TaxID=1977262 RepID=UPI0035B1BFF4
MSFRDSYLFPLRQKVGNDLLLLPGASCLFVHDDGSILLERRSDFGIWGIPAGSPEPGEDIATAIRREMAEETGVEVETVTPYGFASDPRTKTITFPNGHRCQFFVMLFWADWPQGAVPVTSEESFEFGWFRPNALPEAIMPSTPVGIAAYLRFRETGAFQLV